MDVVIHLIVISFRPTYLNILISVKNELNSESSMNSGTLFSILIATGIVFCQVPFLTTPEAPND